MSSYFIVILLDFSFCRRYSYYMYGKRFPKRGYKGKTMVSIKDVAREAGVAISTVSKVLNNYPNVSEDTKKKVLDVVDRLGFVFID